VPLVLWRESATSYGMRLYAPQQTLLSGTADGNYATLATAGSVGSASVSGSTFTVGSATSALAFDNPVLGVVRATGGRNGFLLFTAGWSGFIPDAGGSFELGLRY
jgi:hypothetical protein